VSIRVSEGNFILVDDISFGSNFQKSFFQGFFQNLKTSRRSFLRVTLKAKMTIILREKLLEKTLLFNCFKNHFKLTSIFCDPCLAFLSNVIILSDTLVIIKMEDISDFYLGSLVS